MLGEWEEMLDSWVKMLELSEKKCLAVLRAKAQREIPAGHTEANIEIKFASGH